MAHYAIIEKGQNKVIEVRTGVDENITQIDADGQEVGGTSEAWEAFYTAQLKNSTLFVKRCSYHGNIRNVFPGIGYTYSEELDIFIVPPIIEPENETTQQNET